MAGDDAGWWRSTMHDRWGATVTVKLMAPRRGKPVMTIRWRADTDEGRATPQAMERNRALGNIEKMGVA
ncbi:hypothetical protein E2562_003113 [Oryza meyeriana var. granulata]|uniref:Uncharacterized protein n=1 Tax=Oryza meyeriana var. granulata TaxID=110450 RepID=A0A6G1EA58_9ORYZ|nr:hypothetical protein E2562_003113 [Oryza meyeriana var. granulata]